MKIRNLIYFLSLFTLSLGSLAAEEAPQLDTGDTAWMIVATVLVLFMTLPGLALFYGGLVRSKNVLSVLMQCFMIAGVASILWNTVLYSIAFSGGTGSSWFGNMDKLLLCGIGQDTLSGTIPETVLVMFQLTFAIITPGLIVGAFVERMKFSAVMVFSALWLVLVYAPAVHWVWGGGVMGPDGWGASDLAGGIVVHTTAGVSALVLAFILGPRDGFPNNVHVPHSPGLVMIGACMLWVGWFGFNAGSQLAANGAAGMTMLVTHNAAAAAAITWAIVEKIQTGKAGLVGAVTGMIAGMATITPASGDVGPLGAVALGVIAGIVCYFMCGIVKTKLKIDDSLDVFAVHGVGGMMGSLLLAYFGLKEWGGMGNFEDGSAQFMIQLKAVGATVVWSAIATAVIAYVCKMTVGLRVDKETELTGLDQNEHGESAYNLD